MLELTTIPHINAVLNIITIVLLWVARQHAVAGNEEAHKKTIKLALVVSALFMILYVSYHLGGGFAKFGGEGAVRWVYFPILIVHVVGATALLALVPMAVYFAITDKRTAHKRTVKWTWPIWFFVAVSGVIVYTMALWLYPCEGACLLSGIANPKG